ncbi:MAG: beta-N-acetylglucosaminidase domain-containing protein [Oscillospiraceae bacterium]|nr:beta-N-acetylglucosaminidase domain-containing protein [Oscillospiraceae bacterium]
MNIEVKRLNSRRVLYDEKNHRFTDEKFIVTVNSNNFSIECSGDKSEFYARNYIQRNHLTNGEYIISPSFKVRGYIEGFYGAPWEQSKRLNMLSLMAHYGMNTYFYAPKDDPYHRKLWRELYPENELSDLKVLIKEAKKNFVDFSWCIAPGLDVKYSSDKEFSLLVDKIKQLYYAGVSSFGLLFDDISEELIFSEDINKYSETVNAHIDLVNKLYIWLKDLDSSIHLTVCPTLYHGKGNEYYISKLGKNIPADVSLFWTGKDICSREISSYEAISFIENTNHKPLYWDNYPVNDMAMHFEMHLGPVIGRDKDLNKYSEGIIFNCMEYAECSKIPLITAADYLWNSESYFPEKSWKRAVSEVIGSEKAESFIAFADNLRISCLMDENAKILKKLFFGNSKNEEIACHIARMYDSAEFLKNDMPICSELKNWSEKYFIACDIISLIANYLDSRNCDIKEQIFQLIQKYNSIPERLIDDSDFLEMLYNI